MADFSLIKNELFDATEFAMERSEIELFMKNLKKEDMAVTEFDED